MGGVPQQVGESFRDVTLLPPCVCTLLRWPVPHAYFLPLSRHQDFKVWVQDSAAA